MQRRYIITDSTYRPLVATNQTADTNGGWDDFPGGGKVVGTKGQIITVVDCTKIDAAIRAAGAATLPEPTPSK